MSAILRMLDANANRAREALRVMEDVARFGLDARALAGDIKAVRHELRSVLTFDAMAWRDAEGDVGKETEGAGEYARAGLHGVAAAAGARLTEALRVIEECCKALGSGDAARGVERLRYRSYTIEQRLMLALGSRSRRQWRVCVLVTEAVCVRPWPEVVRSAVEAGCDCIQLREKHLEDGELLARAREAYEITAAAGAALIVNDRLDIAVLAGADGVHLGPRDVGVADARRVVGTAMLVGASTQNLTEAAAAHAAGADYCGVGPMFLTPTKDKPVAGPDYLRKYLAAPGIRDVPHLAIGGITPENVGILVESGCRGVAVSAAVCGADNPGSVVRALLDALGPVPKPNP